MKSLNYTIITMFVIVIMFSGCAVQGKNAKPNTEKETEASVVSVEAYCAGVATNPDPFLALPEFAKKHSEDSPDDYRNALEQCIEYNNNIQGKTITSVYKLALDSGALKAKPQPEHFKRFKAACDAQVIYYEKVLKDLDKSSAIRAYCEREFKNNNLICKALGSLNVKGCYEGEQSYTTGEYYYE